MPSVLGPPLVSTGETMTLTSNSPTRSDRPGLYPVLKRGAEVVGAAALLLACGPLLLALMVLVRAESAGPPLYSQVRLGHRGRRFRIYKLRSMYHDCERLTGPRWSTAGDPRVTPLGRRLRALHLDELPQLWNVVRGDMSLIGPRPERPEIAGELERVVPGYLSRLEVRPGVTGLAQIQLPPDEDIPGVRQKVACDRVYILGMGPWLDARILIGTAMKLAGVPVSWRRALLALPGAVPDAVTGVSPAPEPATALSMIRGRACPSCGDASGA